MRNEMRLLISLLGLACSLSAVGDDTYRTYGDAKGSAAPFSHRGYANSKVPYDKPYDELTIEQKASLRSQYAELSENDEPPFPRDGKHLLVKEIIRIEQLTAVSGDLNLIAQVDERGEVQAVSVLKTPRDDVSNAVSLAIMRTQFKPGKCNGTPCAMEFPLRIRFRVQP